jgi:aryl-alcohol dehydrogenase-like predicted oxidoreductase
MKTRMIGSLKVSVVGLGCNNFGGRINLDETAVVVNAALDAGINFFDTADIYGGTHSEEFLGQVLGARRQNVIIASKFGLEITGQGKGASPAYIRTAVEASLKRLGTDYIDLYQLHRPDDAVPIADTLGALTELVQAGKVREIGCSNFSVAQLQAAEKVSEGGLARFVSVQNEYSLFQREPEQGVLAECARSNTAFLPFFPLASGLLSGKYRQGQPFPTGTRLSGARGEEVLTEANLNKVEALVRFAEAREHTLLELAFSWLLNRPVVASVIAGATKPAQVKDNVAAAVDWTLSAADLAEFASGLKSSPDRQAGLPLAIIPKAVILGIKK